MDRQSDPGAALEARRKYADAFDDTLVKMWEEKQFKLFPPSIRALEKRRDYGRGFRASKAPGGRKRRRTGALIMSTRIKSFSHDNDYSDLRFEEQFLDYGIYVDAGTGREVPLGNPGDIGRFKVRKPKPWFSRKYFLSVMNLREFYAENFGLRTIGMIASALDDKALRDSVRANRGANLTHGIAIPGTNLPL